MPSKVPPPVTGALLSGFAVLLLLASWHKVHQEQPLQTQPLQQQPLEQQPSEQQRHTPHQQKQRKQHHPELPKEVPTKQEFKLNVPVVSPQELRTNKTLRTGHHAFVLKDDLIHQWRATNWTLKKLAKQIPFEWVDFYYYGMSDAGNKPVLLKFDKAMTEFRRSNGFSKYMQVRLSLRGWMHLRKDLDPLPAPDLFWPDEIWLRQCMKKADGETDRTAIDNFYVTNQWKFLLIGETGTSMFFHKDYLAASSWQVQIAGRKRWTLCPPSESHLLSEDIDTFNPKHARRGKFAQARCGQVTLQPGDFVYYPAYWWHHASQLDTPTIAYTGLLVGTEVDRDDLGSKEKKVHFKMYQDLVRKCRKCWTKGKAERHCDDISLKWPGAAPPPLRIVCDEYLPKCVKLWDARARDLLRERSDGPSTEL